MMGNKQLIHQQTGWIHDLARAEVHPEAERLLGYSSGMDPHQIVEESTVEFLMELREKLGEYIKIFNSYSEAGARFQEIKLFSIAQSAADFMMFRNQIKCVVSNSAHGTISISFVHHMASPYSFDGKNPESVQSGVPPQELLAQVGPFRNVKWTFQGEEVTPVHVARYYFAEFVRSTRDPKTSKSSNQILLDQIKALLNEKGLEL